MLIISGKNIRVTKKRNKHPLQSVISSKPIGIRKCDKKDLDNDDIAYLIMDMVDELAPLEFERIIETDPSTGMKMEYRKYLPLT